MAPRTTYVEAPPPASVLLGVEIPATGGDTYFADQNAAYNALPAPLKQRIATMTIKHDAAHTSVGKLRAGFDPFEDPRDAPGTIHPVVRIHEETGAQTLYLGRRERTAATRRNILSAARELILQGNFDPTAQAIAAHTKITRRTLFRHFPDIETLHGEIILDAQDYAHAVMDEPFPAPQSPAPAP